MTITTHIYTNTNTFLMPKYIIINIIRDSLEPLISLIKLLCGEMSKNLNYLHFLAKILEAKKGLKPL